MEKRAVLAIVLSVIVLVGYQYLFIKPKVEKAQIQEQERQALEAQKAKQQQKANLDASDTEQDKKVNDETEAKSEAKSLLTEETSEANGEEKVIKIQTPFYNAVMTSRGGVFKTFELKTHKDEAGKDVKLLNNKGGVVSALAIGDSKDFTLSRKNFITSASDIALEGNDTKEITFTYAYNSINVKRTYKFYANSYKIELKDEVSGLDNYYITLGSNFGIYGTTGIGTHIGPVILQEADRIEFKDDDDMPQEQEYTGNVKWIAQEDKYFFSAMVPLDGQKPATAFKNGEDVLVAFHSDKKVNEFLVYAGPKKYTILKDIGYSLKEIIDFGFFSIIAWPIFWFLLFLDSFLKNYGWAIIVLTIAVRLPFLPLISKGQKSMKKMQQIQPMMTEIRNKYKKDPTRMQKEIMELYKKHKVNPMGGCLPILIQIPVFFALYQVLLIAIELRSAPWIFWIKDLSEKDPYFVLPIIMGITMFIQQKMTPTTADPTQAKIMMFLPIIFTFMFLNFASGLVLYWLISNILSIAQQFYVNKASE
ncbi:Membrane insertion protein, OxaA/YidC [Candidatus Magnetoovum chiemensis]|nr:Membrane insertion protein, OxaA/YidC [Candidatus Magnetoovum chiemensis]